MAADGRSYWPIWIAWSVCGLALAQAGVSWLVPATDRWFALLIALVPLIGLVMALGVILVAGWRDQAGRIRWAWLLLATALGVQIWAMVLESIPTTVLSLNATWLGGLAISVAGIFSVVGSARLWADQRITVGSTFQRLIEAVMVGLVAGLVIGSHPNMNHFAWLIDSSTLLQLIINGIRISAIGVLLVTGRKLAGFLTSALLCGLLAIGMPALMQGDWRAGVLSVEILHWGIVALAAAYRASPAPQQPAGYGLFDRDDVWRGAFSARLIMVSGLAGAVLWPPASLSFVIGLVLLAAAYEGCLYIRHQELQHRRCAFIRRERAAVHEARERDQQLIQSLARLIHDLGPPVQGVSSIADLLMRIAAREVRESPGTISERLGRHADYLEHLIRQLNARLRRQNPPTLRRCRVDVMLIATTVVESLRPLARRRSIDLSVSLGTEATEVLGDENAIRRVLDNLVSNALAVTPTAGVIVVELWIDRSQPDDLTISVRDSGPGLTTEEQQQVFLPREQPSVGPGMGLGLSIVAELTEHLGGAYGVQSEPGAGSTFWVRLPRE